MSNSVQANKDWSWVGRFVAVIIVSLILASAIGSMDLFSKTLGSDYLFIPPSIAIWKGDVGASESLKAKINSVPGVAAVSSLVWPSALKLG